MANYTLIDPELTPWSNPRDILAWVDQLRAMHEASPEDEGILTALEGVERLARMVGVLPDAALAGETGAPADG